mmetsp:Transcript_146104/g.407061  ORF Transcript_146104/g.407061 Transcript_146104/m.407061 type:complete len:237 (+) Transcript_146104:235-945(+)
MLPLAVMRLIKRRDLNIVFFRSAARLLIGRGATMSVEGVHSDLHIADKVLRPVHQYACGGLCRIHDDKTEGGSAHAPIGVGAHGLYSGVRYVHRLHLAILVEVGPEQIRGGKAQLVNSASDEDCLRVLVLQCLKLCLHGPDCTLYGDRGGGCRGASHGPATTTILQAWSLPKATLLFLTTTTAVPALGGGWWPLSTVVNRQRWRVVGQHVVVDPLSLKFLGNHPIFHLADASVCVR